MFIHELDKGVERAVEHDGVAVQEETVPARAFLQTSIIGQCVPQILRVPEQSDRWKFQLDHLATPVTRAIIYNKNFQRRFLGRLVDGLQAFTQEVLGVIARDYYG
jgi:hypothetical protein